MDGLNLTLMSVGPVTLPQGIRLLWSAHRRWCKRSHPGEMIATACELANEQFDINFADYDWDNDGEVEQVYILFAGRTEASGGGTRIPFGLMSGI